MTYAAEQVKAGRLPVTVVELDLDTCSLTYGSAPCTASGGSGAECYNTQKTCQDLPNYTKTTKTYRFVEPVEGLPAGIEMIPSVTGVRLAPTRILSSFGLGQRASVTVSMQDHTHHDRGIDPYVGNRSYDPAAVGTFWGRLRARTPYYQGRTLRIRSGYLEHIAIPYVIDPATGAYITDPATGARIISGTVSSGFDWSNFQSREYFIEEIRGPDKNGRVDIIAKDVLKLADAARAQAPAASGGELLNDLDAVSTSAAIVNGTYAASGWIRIGDELIQYTTRSGSGTFSDPWVLSGMTRNDVTFGSLPDTHDEGDSVQQCLVYQAQSVRDVIDDLLVNYAGIDSAYIVAADWDAEEATWLSAATVTTIISEPTGVDQLIAELQEQCQLRIWWDEVNQEIRFKVLAAPTGVSIDALDRDSHILADSVRVKDMSKDRLSQVWIYYDPADYTSTELSNYKRLFIQSDALAEGDDQYAETRVHTIKSRWFDESNLAIVSQTASRYLANRRDNPREISFSLDAKDSGYQVGDVVSVAVDEIQAVDGSRADTRVLITQAEEKVGGHRYDFVALTGIGGGRYGNIGPNTLNNYTAESDANQIAYAFICDSATLKMSNGDDPYQVI